MHKLTSVRHRYYPVLQVISEEVLVGIDFFFLNNLSFVQTNTRKEASFILIKPGLVCMVHMIHTQCLVSCVRFVYLNCHLGFVSCLCYIWV